MNIYRLEETDSTNTFLKDALRDKTLNTPTCVWAKEQTNGRGQRGAQWASKSGLNHCNRP